MKKALLISAIVLNSIPALASTVGVGAMYNGARLNFSPVQNITTSISYYPINERDASYIGFNTTIDIVRLNPWETQASPNTVYAEMGVNAKTPYTFGIGLKFSQKNQVYYKLGLELWNQSTSTFDQYSIHPQLEVGIEL